MGGERVCYDGDFHLSPIGSVWGFSCCAERSNRNTGLFCSTNRAGVAQAGLPPQQPRSPHTWRGLAVPPEVPRIVFWAKTPHAGLSKPNAEPGRHSFSPQSLPGAACRVQPPLTLLGRGTALRGAGPCPALAVQPSRETWVDSRQQPSYAGLAVAPLAQRHRGTTLSCLPGLRRGRLEPCLGEASSASN